MQRLNDLFTLLLLHIRPLRVLVQKTVQILVIHEYLGTYKVKQREQLLQVVLQRCSRNQQPSPRYERPNDLRKNRIDVLDSVRFVNDDILERKLLQSRFFDETDLVGRYTDFKVLRYQAGGDDFGAFVFCSC